MYNLKKQIPALVGVAHWSDVILQNKRSQVQVLVRGQAWIVGWIPGWSQEAMYQCFSPSLSLFPSL